MGRLLAYQKAWMTDRSPVKVIEKSRRIGLSWCDAADSALVAAKKISEGGMSTYYLSYNKEMTAQYISDVAYWARKYHLAASEIEEIVLEGDDKATIYQVRFASGFVVQALSSKPSNLRSKKGRVRIDEAAFVEDLPEQLKAAIALTMWGGDVAVMSTHNGEDNDFNTLIQDIRAGRLDYSLHRVTLDDALEQGLYKAICREKQSMAGSEEERAALTWSPEAEADWREKLIKRYGDGADEELFCIPSRSGGAYLPRSIIENAMRPDIPVLRWSPPAKDFVDWSDDRRYRDMAAWIKAELDPWLAILDPARPHWLGEDFGRLVDLTSFWPLAEMPGLSWRTPFIVELRNCPFSQQEQVLFHLGGRLPRFSGAALDKGGNGAFLAERARQRFGAERVHEIASSSGWYLANFPPLKAALEDGTLILPRDEEVLDDFRAVKVVKGVPQVPKAERTTAKDAGKRHGDSAVAACLALYAARNIEAGGPVEYTPVVQSRFRPDEDSKPDAPQAWRARGAW